MLGSGAQPSASSVSNEITLGDASVTKVRMGNGDLLYSNGGGSVGNIVQVKQGTLTTSFSTTSTTYVDLVTIAITPTVNS